MKKLLLLFLLPFCLFGAAGDIKISYKAANNVSWIDAIFTKQNNVLLGLGSAGVPQIASTAGAFTFTGLLSLNQATLTNPTPFTGTVLHLTSADSTSGLAFIDTFAGVAGFSGRRANGTSASPTALASSDIIVGMFGLGYGATGYSSASRTSVRLVALENWTDTAQGAYASIVATPAGSTTGLTSLNVYSDGIAVPNGLYRVTSNVTYSSNTTLANITGLSATVIAGNTYTFRAKLLGSGASVPSAGGIKVAISGTCTATSIIASISGSFGTSATGPFYRTVVSALNSAASNTPTGDTSLDMTVEGTITAATSGTLTIQAAQVTASGTTTVGAGSFLWIQRY